MSLVLESEIKKNDLKLEDAEGLATLGVPVGQTCIIPTYDGAGLVYNFTFKRVI